MHAPVRLQCILVLLWLPAPLVSAPVQWRTEDGGNGHFYELVRPPGGIKWTLAEKAAAEREFEGVSGHLVTVNSREENDFLVARFRGRDGRAGDGIWAWIGFTDRLREGQFVWITGEPVTYTNWGGGEPNNVGGNEHFAHYVETNWNDGRDANSGGGFDLGYIVEYPVSPFRFRRGDVDGDGRLSITDPVRILRRQFLGEGSALPCLDAADANDDGDINLSDAIGLLGYIFLGTFAPPAPFGACGPDPGEDDLDCEAYPTCAV